ncbi:MAG: OmpA family protein [Bergeyella sp.]|nr:OmpA family protein [Bergeyella sp.]
MKNLKLGITALGLAISSAVFAQTTTNPWLIGVGAQAANYPAATGVKDLSKETVKRLYRVRNWSVAPPLSKLTVARNLGKLFVVDWQTSVGNISNKRIQTPQNFFLMTGLGLQFKFNGLWNENHWFDPYVRVGGNYLRSSYPENIGFPLVDKNGHTVTAFNKDGDVAAKKNFFTVNAGAGLNVWFTEKFGLGAQLDYVNTFAKTSVVNDFFQGSASLLFRLGNNDRDKDGVPDKEDRCPDTPGLAEFKGCPDTDGDGVPDIDDACPDVAGPVENKGCPWPDTDGDGVLDKDDACVDVPGPVENNGCPWPDTDGDGILDKDDECPTVPGKPEYKGCPGPNGLTVSTGEASTTTLKDILFDFDKATINPRSNEKLDKAAELIKATVNENFIVVGMTDKKGNPAYNLNLSKRRAAAVVKALEARGVPEDKLKSIGIGSQEATVPASASNEERQVDRKVVVRAISGDEWLTYKKSDLPPTPVHKKATHRKGAGKKRVVKKK